MIVDGVGGLEVGLSVGFPGFEDIGGERRQAELFQIQRFPQDFEYELSAGYCFLDAQLWGGADRG
ncbi:MAG: hypothetical protein EBQ51_08705 [Verrucomicrobia bacterium]|nr:hypothetical protein [Verrucomicrobiota bacterium]